MGASMVYPALATVPPAGPNSPALFVSTSATVDAGTVFDIDFGRPFVKVGLVRFKIKHVAGSAASFTPLIFSESGVGTAGDISQEYAGSTTLVANLFDPQLADAPVVMQADENGKLYFFPGPNAGADNQFEYALRFLVYG
ncbi:MAG: hypothetical protein RJB55_2094 [Verrucomicrobiota bacterium]|jgi:hypothetical protein